MHIHVDNVECAQSQLITITQTKHHLKPALFVQIPETKRKTYFTYDNVLYWYRKHVVVLLGKTATETPTCQV